MGRSSTSELVLKVLGLLPLTAAVLKGHELLTVPVANRDLWSWRPFLIFKVDFELVLAVWLLSGVFRRPAWLASLLCFGLFCCVTLYKGLTGAASCGCFGTVHVNPLGYAAGNRLAGDGRAEPIPPTCASRPTNIISAESIAAHGRGPQISLRSGGGLEPLPSLRRFAATVALGAAILAVTTPVPALNEPAAVTSTYEILEPKTWIGKELPILEYIDIGEHLRSGNWLVLFYHHDCPDCRRAIPQCEQMARGLRGNKDVLRIAVIEVPPCGPGALSAASLCVRGHLAKIKEWFVATPVMVLLAEGKIVSTWEIKMPLLDVVVGRIPVPGRTNDRSLGFSASTSERPQAP